jgi:hypothetical protein
LEQQRGELPRLEPQQQHAGQPQQQYRLPPFPPAHDESRMAPDTQVIAPVPDIAYSGQTGSFCTILGGGMNRHWPKVLLLFLCRNGYQTCLASEVDKPCFEEKIAKLERVWKEKGEPGFWGWQKPVRGILHECSSPARTSIRLFLKHFYRMCAIKIRKSDQKTSLLYRLSNNTTFFSRTSIKYGKEKTAPYNT